MTSKITVVATAGTCEIVLTELGFYVRCNDCSYVSEAPIHAKFRARMAGDAHKCETDANPCGVPEAGHDCGEPGRPVEFARCGDCWDQADEAHA